MSVRPGTAARPGEIDRLITEAVALQSRGRIEEAARVYERVLKLDSGVFPALHNLGVIRIQQGRPDAARPLLRKAVNRDPGSADAHNNLGNALQMLGAHAEAVGRYEKALRLKPDHAGALGNLAIAYQAIGRRDEAVRLFERACAAAPESAGAWLNLARSLRSLDRNEEALAAADRALALQPDHAEALILSGIALEATGRPEAAIVRLQRVLAADPDNTEALVVLAGALRTAGRFAEARDALEKTVRLAPTTTRYVFKLAEVTPFTPDTPLLAAMETQRRALGPDAQEDAMYLDFALGKAYAELGRHLQSFAHVLEANRRKRRLVAYDEAATLAAIDRNATVFTAPVMAQHADAGDPSEVPVFIVGMPRSGTTLIEQILASHPAIFGAGELPYLETAIAAAAAPGPAPDWTAERLRRLARTYLGRVQPLAPAAQRITDKMPANFQHLGLIHLAFPNARIIHARRDPVDTCLSCFFILFGSEGQSFSYDLAELGRYYRAYDRVMAHWRAILPPRVLIEVQYEDVVADLDREARRIVAHCGLPWDEACLAFHETERPVRTASLNQVRQPIYSSSIGRWRRYGRMLAPLFDALELDMPEEGG